MVHKTIFIGLISLFLIGFSLVGGESLDELIDTIVNKIVDDLPRDASIDNAFVVDENTKTVTISFTVSVEGPAGQLSWPTLQITDSDGEISKYSIEELKGTRDIQKIDKWTYTVNKLIISKGKKSVVILELDTSDTNNSNNIYSLSVPTNKSLPEPIELPEPTLPEYPVEPVFLEKPKIENKEIEILVSGNDQAETIELFQQLLEESYTGLSDVCNIRETLMRCDLSVADLQQNIHEFLGEYVLSRDSSKIVKTRAELAALAQKHYISNNDRIEFIRDYSDYLVAAYYVASLRNDNPSFQKVFIDN